MAKLIIWVIALVAHLGLAGVIEGQEQGKKPRIAYISGRVATSPGPLVAAFRSGLAEVGYIEGKNNGVEYRFGATANDVFERYIVELLDLKVDLVVIPVQVTTAKRLIKTTPIVMISNLDPVDHGVIYSLERPGGNITGVTTLSRTLSSRRLELRKAAVPQARRFGAAQYGLPKQ